MNNVYETLWNGDNIFRINIINNKIIRITELETNKVKEIKYEDVFIGKSEYNEMTRFSGGHGSKFDGNSILIKESGLKYTFIGHEMYSFLACSEIIEFFSPVGNNLVPYSYAIDKEGKNYLFLEKMIIESKKEDPYSSFYEHRLITEDKAYLPPKKPVIDYGINKWIIGKKSYTMTYENNPEYKYDCVTKYGKLEMKIKSNDGKIIPFTKTDYVLLMKRVEDVNGFSKMNLI
jgi:hypothetical protein